MTEERLYSPDELAEIFRVAPSTLARWRRTGEPHLPYIRLGNRIRYRASEVQEFLDQIRGDVNGEDAEDDED